MSGPVREDPNAIRAPFIHGNIPMLPPSASAQIATMFHKYEPNVPDVTEKFVKFLVSLPLNIEIQLSTLDANRTVEHQKLWIRCPYYLGTIGNKNNLSSPPGGHFPYVYFDDYKGELAKGRILNPKSFAVYEQLLRDRFAEGSKKSVKLELLLENRTLWEQAIANYLRSPAS